jgi:hypothetical protein
MVLAWPPCAIADCPHKACLPSDRCHAHAHGLPLRPENPDVFGYFALVDPAFSR